MPAAAGAGPAAMRLDVAALPALRTLGFTGGRDSFAAFCARAFAAGAPRFLRTDDNDLVVFRHADLRALGAAAAIGNLPPGAMFPAGVIDDLGRGVASLGTGVAGLIGNQLFTANPPLHRKLRRARRGPRPAGAGRRRAGR